MVAIGMKDGSLCTADASAFSSSLVSVSNHRHSKLTGIDILCQGTEFCVVSVSLRKKLMSVSDPHDDVWECEKSECGTVKRLRRGQFGSNIKTSHSVPY